MQCPPGAVNANDSSQPGLHSWDNNGINYWQNLIFALLDMLLLEFSNSQQEASHFFSLAIPRVERR